MDHVVQTDAAQRLSEFLLGGRENRKHDFGAQNIVCRHVTAFAPPFLYRCPNTGDNVQAWAADDPEDDDLTYVQVTCLACGISLLLKRSSPTSSHAPKALGVRKSSTA